MSKVLVHDARRAVAGRACRLSRVAPGRFDLHDVTTPVALQMIARFSGGRYAATDVLCQMSLLMLRQLGLDRLEARIVRQAVANVGGAAEREARSRCVSAKSSPRSRHTPARSRGGQPGRQDVARVTLGPRTLIGRSDDNDVCLPSPYLSRHHAAIIATPEGYYLVDLDSINGVLLNGQRIERTVLCDEDVLAIGPFRLKLQVPEAATQDSPSPEAQAEEGAISDTAVLFPQIQEQAV